MLCVWCSDGRVHKLLWKDKGVRLAESVPGAQRQQAGRVRHLLLEKVSKVGKNEKNIPRGRKSVVRGERWGLLFLGGSPA